MKSTAAIVLLTILALAVGNQPSLGIPHDMMSGTEPSHFPDRIMLTIPGDPATSRAVSWRTIFSDTVSIGEIAPCSASPKFDDQVVQVTGIHTPWQDDDPSAMAHQVIFTGLKPSSEYIYRVGNGTEWSEWFQFRTASDKTEPFSFLYFGDVQNDIRSLGSRVLRQAYSHFPDAGFMLFAGDLVGRSQEDYWSEFFYAGDWIFGMMPAVPTPGNHEYNKPVNEPRTFSKHWKQIFNMPSNSPGEKYQDRMYFMDYQGVRFISFDSPAFGEFNEDSTLLLNWLEETLRANPNRWTVFFTHYPIYSCSQGRNNEQYRNALQPLLEKYSVDLVLAGHDHTYCRGFNQERAMMKTKNLPLYVVSMAGPKMYGLNTSFWADRVASMIQLYQHISISGNKLEYKSFTVSGELYDHFVILKNRQGRNQFREGRPVGKIEQRIEIPADAIKRYSEEDLQKFREKFGRNP
jgi:hypothetical protein